MQDEIKIRVPGTTFDIYLNSTYEIVEKLDPTAPRGYKDLGTTKPLDYNNTTDVAPRFDGQRNIWDLGLSETSPAIQSMDKSDRNRHMALVQKHIIGPMLKTKPKDFLEPVPKNKKEFIRDNDYNGLENYIIPLGIDRFFDTSVPEDLFKLYITVYSKDLCPKEDEMNPEYRQADFCVVNNRKKTSRQEDNRFQKSKAMAKLVHYFDTDKKFTFDILRYVGIDAGKGSNEQTVVNFFDIWLNNKTDRSGENAKYFLETLERLTSKKGEEELYLYNELSKMYDNKELVKRGGEYFLDGESLGADIKIIAEQAQKDENLKEKILGKSLA